MANDDQRDIEDHLERRELVELNRSQADDHQLPQQPDEKQESQNQLTASVNPVTNVAAVSKSATMKDRLESLLTVITSDRMVMAILVVLCIYVYFFTEPHQQGFWCNDQSIRMPFRPLTIGLGAIITIAVIVPTVVIILIEYNSSDSAIVANLRRVHFANLTNLLVMLFFKFTTGRLRPHFFSVCQPSVTCDQGHTFVEDYQCLNSSRRAVSQARQSFFSGHASIGINAAVYMMMYLQDRWPFHGGLFKATIQFAIFIVGCYPGVTQINNFWHHWSDVAVGYGVGIANAIINYSFVAANY